jgi:hypothetical protein
MKKIKLTQGKYALVDDADFDALIGFKWCAYRSGKTFYAKRNERLPNGKLKDVDMHRILMGSPVGMLVDHIDGDGLNNQRANLRVCTHAQNLRNRALPKNNKSGYRGVCWDKRINKWKASISCEGKNYNLGHFTAVEDAGIAYNKAAAELFGEFAFLNKIPKKFITPKK